MWKAQEWPGGWQMSGPRAAQNLQIPLPWDWQGGQMPRSSRGEGGRWGGVGWCAGRRWIWMMHATNAPTISMLSGAGGKKGMGWGFGCLCWPWGRAFDWPCSPRRGDIWIFLHPTWRYLTADLDEKDWNRTYVSHFHASHMCRTVWKYLEIMGAN